MTKTILVPIKIEVLFDNYCSLDCKSIKNEGLNNYCKLNKMELLENFQDLPLRTDFCKSCKEVE